MYIFNEDAQTIFGHSSNPPNSILQPIREAICTSRMGFFFLNRKNSG